MAFSRTFARIAPVDVSTPAEMRGRTLASRMLMQSGMTTPTRPGIADLPSDSPPRTDPTADTYALVREVTSLRRRVVALEDEVAALGLANAAMREDFKVLHAMYRPFRTAPYKSAEPIVETVFLPEPRKTKLKI